MRRGDEIEDLLRQSAPQVLAALVRQYRNFETAEDAVQEALLAAATQWPERGVPDRPVGWLIRVASRRLTDQWRSEQAGRQREERVVSRTAPDERLMPPADVPSRDADDTLLLLLLCCHPSLTPASQIALTLRAVGGLDNREIARAFLTPEATMTQRISRARQRVRAAGAKFELPPEHERAERMRVVLHALYLIFNEGYTATSGPSLHRADLTREAIRLTRIVHRALPDDGEVGGLLALMLLTDARRAARTRSDGSLVPLAEQDRGRWNRESIDEGLELITRTLSRAKLGAYQLQAAIAAVHSEATHADETDWPQIEQLYRLLEAAAPNPMVILGHAVARAMVRGPQAGLDLLEPLTVDGRLSGHHRLHAVRAHLLELAGDHAGALGSYRRAARLTTSLPEQHYLHGRAARLAAKPGDPRVANPQA
ncbi:RNA polymerase sigma factor [Amycolatopsis saalfeldensis]|uniref:RNA polymerase sigma factor, sigma-70 family n=1 Tax=Amycolatopsis saalfeldensis TaxID=394193 RepID=A0A1H8YJQ7_9PSEU|nr:sigma-70 family RNA polymerase sigma factor [Amycolatopsis saalfeldensis]SEP52377.1 RNA polymerase sigma factor, sigma-70 family [Amycolatopsis saalfeldensis]